MIFKSFFKFGIVCVKYIHINLGNFVLNEAAATIAAKQKIRLMAVMA
jgi:hypothetical protein